MRSSPDSRDVAQGTSPPTIGSTRMFVPCRRERDVVRQVPVVGAAHRLDVRPAHDHTQLGDAVRAHVRQLAILLGPGSPGELLRAHADEPERRFRRDGLRRRRRHQTGRDQAHESETRQALPRPPLCTPILASLRLSSAHGVRPFRRTLVRNDRMHRRCFGECSGLKRRVSRSGPRTQGHRRNTGALATNPAHPAIKGARPPRGRVTSAAAHPRRGGLRGTASAATPAPRRTASRSCRRGPLVAYRE